MTTFCNKCGKPDNYKGKDKLIKVCDCIEKAKKKQRLKQNKEASMKKLFLGLVLALVFMVGCGNFGNFEVESTTTKSYDYNIIATTPFTDYADNQVLQNTTDASVTAASWSIIANTGGAGTIDLKLLAYGADCSGIGTIISIPVTANTTVSDTALDAATISAINGVLPANSQYRACMITTPASSANPMNLTLRFKITIKGTMK